MIFSNEGICQISGEPFQNTLELTQILRTIKKRAGADTETADAVVVLAGRLSTITQSEQDEFCRRLNVTKPDTMHGVMDELDKFLAARR